MKIRQLSVESDNSRWVQNSKLGNSYESTFTYSLLLYLIIAFGSVILIQSFLLHKLRFKIVRTVVDTSAATAILLAVFLLFAFSEPNLTKTAILRDFFRLVN